MRLWEKVSELADELPEDEETATLGVFSRLLRLDYAWRIGMDKHQVDALMAETRRSARPRWAICARSPCSAC